MAQQQPAADVGQVLLLLWLESSKHSLYIMF